MRARQSRGFSLTEVLIVLVIIAVLVAILFPVFGKSKVVAKRTLCASNLKQISTGCALYLADFEDKYPTDVRSEPINDGEVDWVSWDQLLLPYIKSDQVFTCPEDKATRKQQPIWNGKYSNPLVGRSYSITNRIVTNTSDGKNDPKTGVFGKSGTELGNPAQMVAWVESWGTFNRNGEYINDSVLSGGGGSTFLGCDAWKLPRERTEAVSSIYSAFCPEMTDSNLRSAAGHDRMGNYIFADGHLKAYKFTEAIANNFGLFKGV